MDSSKPASRRTLETSHDFAMWMIQLADAKASILMAASAVLAGLLVPQSVSTCNLIDRGFLVSAVGLALATALTSLETLFPRTEPAEHESLVYFHALLRFKGGAEYVAHLRTLSDEQSDEELARQTWELAHTQKRKYLWLRLGVWLFGLCLASTFIGVLLTRLPC